MNIWLLQNRLQLDEIYRLNAFLKINSNLENIQIFSNCANYSHDILKL